MTSKYQQLLNAYYKDNDIHPLYFNCPYKKDVCKSYAKDKKMTEAKMSMVGSRYGETYPKIVVVSLDPPSPEPDEKTSPHWRFKTPKQRTTEKVSSTHEKDDYQQYPPNVHWAMTQIIVKDILALCGYQAQPYAPKVPDSYDGHLIENVSQYFAHVNVAKCSMNKVGKLQANTTVHETCRNAYLLGELMILEPDILITQGESTNNILGIMLVGYKVLISDLPLTRTIMLGNKQVLWMPMRHPAHQLRQIREAWPVYLRAVKAWAKKYPG
jgi:hypothetical protein